jgi:hypothetical protein
MGIFNKFFTAKSNNSETITFIPESWGILQGDNNGNAMIVRKNIGCDTIAGNADYPNRCGIAFEILFPDENGLPSFEKEPEIDNIENDIFEIFESDLNSITPIIITTSGFREFVLYTKDVEEFNTRLEKMKLKYPKYQFTNYTENDKNWSTYKSFK